MVQGIPATIYSNDAAIIGTELQVTHVLRDGTILAAAYTLVATAHRELGEAPSHYQLVDIRRLVPPEERERQNVLDQLAAAAEKFVRKIENGRASSREIYAELKAALAANRELERA
jgi:hypothetical protein